MHEIKTQTKISCPQEDRYQITIPPLHELDSTHELHVIDRQTGQIVRVLERTDNYKLCDGVTLQVRASEMPLWIQETALARQLSTHQHKQLQEIFSRLEPGQCLSRKEIVKIVEKICRPHNLEKYRQSGHLIDGKLKYSKPTSKSSFLDTLSPETKQKIDQSKIEVTAEGIKLTPSENKLIHAFNRLLHEKSQNYNPHSDDFYVDFTVIRGRFPSHKKR